MKMEMYLFQQTQDLYNFYYKQIKNEVTYGGHVDVGAYLLLLQNMEIQAGLGEPHGFGMMI